MIINSLLDTDLYKCSMQQIVLHRFPRTEVEYKFKCRNKTGLGYLASKVEEEVKHLCTLRFTDDELDYISTLRYISKDYGDFLRNFQMNYENIDIEDMNGNLEITICGPWRDTILFEVPVLAIVNELYFREEQIRHEKKDPHIATDSLYNKIEKVKSLHDMTFLFADFGTRRRYSAFWHEEIIKTLLQHIPGNFVGTSNVYFAKKYGIKPIGTMAHEYLQAMQAIVNPLYSQKYALDQWAKEYRGDLGIALSDTLGIDAFLKDFDLYFCKLFDGVRHDSGDPITWTTKVIEHYKSMGIDPKTKTAVYSDGLDIDKAIDLYHAYRDRIKVSFGIGTNLTNDCGYEPLNIVIKLTKCNGLPTAKISDSHGKIMCEDNKYIEYLKDIFGIREE